MDRYFKYHRIEPHNNIDVWEDVAEELWQWEAHYTDGTILKQFDTDTPLPQFGPNYFLFHTFDEIDQSRLQYFKVVSPRLTKQHILMFNRERWKLICLYRRANLVVKAWKDAETGDITHTERRNYTAFVYGYENKVAGIAIKHFTVIMPNGEVVVTDNLDTIKIDAVPEIIVGKP